jgi:nucleoid-associated protein YgaU
MRPYRWLAIAALDGAALDLTASGVPNAVRLLASGVPMSVDGAAATLGLTVVQLAAAWLAVGLLADLAAQLPGAVGSAARRVRARILPRLVQRVVAGALGVGIVAGPAVAAANPPQPAGPTRAVPAPAWPTDNPIPVPLWPTDSVRSESAATPKSDGAAPHSGSGSVRVRPGDTLWAIAARSLSGRRTPDRIAAAWPRWWAANRSVIGPDPDLVRPGQVLTAPADERKELPR